jgi:hypothetical protein
MRVTGIGFTMESTTSPYDNGGWVTSGGYDALFSGFKEHGGLIALRPGASAAGVLPGLRKLGAAASGGQPLLFISPAVPRQFGEIADVRLLPIALGGFLILLAVGAVGHALMTAVLACGLLLALIPGHRAARLRAGPLLREE